MRAYVELGRMKMSQHEIVLRVWQCHTVQHCECGLRVWQCESGNRVWQCETVQHCKSGPTV